MLGAVACDPDSAATTTTGGTTSEVGDSGTPEKTSSPGMTSNGHGDSTTTGGDEESTTSGTDEAASSTTSGGDSSSSGDASSSSSESGSESSSTGMDSTGVEDATLRVFVTSAVTNAALGGTSGADTLCTDLASAAGLGGTWSAWLSTTTVDASSRIDPTGAPYTLVDGTVVAADFADLLDGAIDNPINRDENGNPVAADVWTGTLEDGTSFGLDCGGWTTTAGTGHCGAAVQSNFRWTNNVTPPCFAGLRVYCFEDGA